MKKADNKTAISIAFISLIGYLGITLVTNWYKVFPDVPDTVVTSSEVQLVQFRSSSSVIDGETLVVGTWLGKDKVNQDIKLTFTADNKVIIYVGNDRGAGTYQVDFSKYPPHLDIDFGSEDKIHTILQFSDEGQLQIENTNPGDSRPESFIEKSVFFTRKE